MELLVLALLLAVVIVVLRRNGQAVADEGEDATLDTRGPDDRGPD